MSKQTVPPSQQEAADPFSAENAPTVQIIMQMRIYDVLMALLTNVDEEAAERLLELHANGTIFGSIPSLNGRFIADEMLSTGSDE